MVFRGQCGKSATGKIFDQNDLDVLVEYSQICKYQSPASSSTLPNLFGQSVIINMFQVWQAWVNMYSLLP